MTRAAFLERSGNLHPPLWGERPRTLKETRELAAKSVDTEAFIDFLKRLAEPKSDNDTLRRIEAAVTGICRATGTMANRMGDFGALEHEIRLARQNFLRLETNLTANFENATNRTESKLSEVLARLEALEATVRALQLALNPQPRKKAPKTRPKVRRPNR